MKPDPYDNPTRNTAVLANLVGNMRLIHVMPMLAELTLDEVIEYWWAAQLQRKPLPTHDGASEGQ